MTKPGLGVGFNISVLMKMPSQILISNTDLTHVFYDDHEESNTNVVLLVNVTLLPVYCSLRNNVWLFLLHSQYTQYNACHFQCGYIQLEQHEAKRINFSKIKSPPISIKEPKPGKSTLAQLPAFAEATAGEGGEMLQ